MNRPFFAFGVLLALLALAMVAVSSTGRSTPVQAQPAAADGSSLDPRPGRGSIYVVVLPQADEQAARAESPVSSLTPVCVVPAELDAARPPVIEGFDCLSLYDAAYDRLVYGSWSAPTPAAISRELTRQEASADELLAIFRSLGASSPNLWWQDLYDRMVHTVARLQPIFRGIRNWPESLAVRWGWSKVEDQTGPAVNWDDYAALMDSVADSRPEAGFAKEPVRSSGWLLHFAVSSLSRMGLALEQAAAELQRFEGESLPGESKSAAE